MKGGFLLSHYWVSIEMANKPFFLTTYGLNSLCNGHFFFFTGFISVLPWAC